MRLRFYNLFCLYLFNLLTMAVLSTYLKPLLRKSSKLCIPIGSFCPMTVSVFLFKAQRYEILWFWKQISHKSIINSFGSIRLETWMFFFVAGTHVACLCPCRPYGALLPHALRVVAMNEAIQNVWASFGFIWNYSVRDLKKTLHRASGPWMPHGCAGDRLFCGFWQFWL